jgi:hypothetical protein
VSKGTDENYVQTFYQKTTREGIILEIKACMEG